MTKKELVREVAERAIISQVEADRIIRITFDAIKKAVAHDEEEVKVPDFGIFSPVERSARTGRNPQTGEEIQIPAKKAVKFKASKNFNLL